MLGQFFSKLIGDIGISRFILICMVITLILFVVDLVMGIIDTRGIIAVGILFIVEIIMFIFAKLLERM